MNNLIYQFKHETHFNFHIYLSYEGVDLILLRKNTKCIVEAGIFQNKTPIYGDYSFPFIVYPYFKYNIPVLNTVSYLILSGKIKSGFIEVQQLK